MTLALFSWNRRGVPAAMAAGMVLAVAACGGSGGVGFGGTGTEPPSVADGTLTGFGSVVVDGSSYAWSTDTARRETGPGVFVAATPRLGESVRVEFEGATGVERATDVRVEAAVTGQVESVDGARSRFVVLGQTVVVNASAAGGPVTFFDGIGGIAGVKVGDLVEVHGRPRQAAGSGAAELLASRIGAGSGTARRVSGVVTAVSGSGASASLRVGNLDVAIGTATLAPAGAVPAVGDRVVAWADTEPQAGRLAATGLRLVPRGAVDSGARTRLAGSIGVLDEQARTFQVVGVPVRYGNAVVAPQGPNFALADLVYVRVEGTLAGDGVVDATKVQIRKQGGDEAEVELTGSIASFAAPARFTLRGTPVDASGVTVLQGCGNRPLADGLAVRVTGTVATSAAGSVVSAESVRCTGN